MSVFGTTAAFADEIDDALNDAANPAVHTLTQDYDGVGNLGGFTSSNLTINGSGSGNFIRTNNSSNSGFIVGNSQNFTLNNISMYGFNTALTVNSGGTLTIQADGGNSIFSGNGIAVSLDGGNLTLTATNGGVITLDDPITSSNPYSLNLTGDFSGIININNSIGNASILMEDTIVKLADVAYFNELDLTANGTVFLDLANDKIQELGLNTLTLNTYLNLRPEADLANGIMDTISAGTLTLNGNGINVTQIVLVSDSETEQTVIQFADGELKDSVTLGDELAVSPVYEYLVQYDSNTGAFTFDRTSSFNPAVFRAQVATLAAYQNQLISNGILFDHALLNGNINGLFEATGANKYAMDLYSLDAYRQNYIAQNGRLWAKTYGTFETLSMTQGLNVRNNTYGTIVGADMPVVELKNGWKLMPTAYIAYNGGRQTFNKVGAWQNGGQGGFMGTFSKNDFLGSIMAYAGGYGNEMSAMGVTDKTGNWFAGAATKAAYNFHPSEHFIIQPNLLAAYNAFGGQKFNSGYGALSMASGMLNGLNIAPGVNFIYNRDTWSLYLTTSYMYNIMDKVSGKAGGVDLPDVSMRHGYIEYGIGGTKTFKDRLTSYAQFVIRNGGRTGVGIQAGLTWRF